VTEFSPGESGKLFCHASTVQKSQTKNCVGLRQHLMLELLVASNAGLNCQNFQKTICSGKISGIAMGVS
jgi:hypothetical protein